MTKHFIDLLTSLWHEDAKLRSQEIDRTRGKTFEWIWTNSALGFESWLEGKNTLFWISGKPGSGKSTFMKYIYNDFRTQRVLNQQSDRKRHYLYKLRLHECKEKAFLYFVSLGLV
jgi:polynucleotide 5'-kinase involved in rRNA processing